MIHINSLGECKQRADGLLKNYYDSTNPLYPILEYALFASSKRMRATLAYLGCGIVGGRIEDADNIAKLYEFTTAAYIADDDKDLDNGKLRNHMPALWVKYGKANATLAVLELLSEPSNLLSQPPVVSHQQRLQEIYYKSCTDTIRGEVLNQELSRSFNHPVDKSRIIDMARLKTSSLLVGALTSGAIVGGGNENDILALGKCAEKFGIAYEATDHIVDAMAEESQIGKDTFSDIRTGKKNLVINHALQVLPEDKKKFISNLSGRELTIDEKKEVREIFVKSGSIRYAYDIVLDYNRQGLKELSPLKTNEYIDLLRQVPDMYTRPLEPIIAII